MSDFAESIDVSDALKKESNAKEFEKKSKAYTPPDRFQELPPSKTVIGLLLLLCLITGTLHLIQPQRLGSVADSVTEQYWAGVQQQVAQVVQQDYPQLSSAEKNKLALQLYTKERDDKKHNAILTQYIESTKDFYRDDAGVVYPYGVDSYYYLRQTRNLLDHGTVGEDGDTDTLGHAPFNETIYQKRGYSYLQYYWHPIGRFFSPTFEGSLIYLPLVLGIGSLILIFIIGALAYGPYGGFLAAFMLAISQRFFVQNYAGFLDTNAFNLFLSLLYFLFVLLCIRSTDWKKRTLFALLSLFTFYVFYNSWTGSYYVLLITALFSVCYGLTYLLQHRNYGIAGAFVLLSALGLFLFQKTIAYRTLLARLSLTPPATSFFNPGYFMISELKSSTPIQLIDAFGGYFLALLALLSIVHIVYHLIKGNATEHTLFALWFIPILIAGALSRRFLYYSAPPFALLIAYGFVFVLPSFAQFIHSLLPTIKRPQLVASLTFALLIVILVSDDLLQTQTYKPAIDDSIVNTALWIDTHTALDSILTPWWDYGYIYQYYARRPVTFGPNSFNDMRSYWVSRLYLTNETDRALGTLRMINCGAEHRVFGLRGEHVPEKSQFLKTFGPEFSTLTRLNTSFNTWGVDPDVLPKVYCDVPPSYVIISDDYLGKLGSMAALAEQEFRTTIEESKEVKVSRISPCVRQGSTLLCDNDYRIEGKNATNRGKHPAALYSYLNGTRTVVRYSDTTVTFSLVVYETMSGVYSFLLDEPYADSVLVRMLARDRTMDGFTLVHDEDYPHNVVVYEAFRNR